ncbi:hypothetical protein HYE15_01005 [Mycoplasmopsis bovis]|nr:hypothetical protein [Mycoplasmopsis bovis]QQH25508.1 hypothetical protein HYE15_01005 [Mycoplasmopsis bovis]
MIAASCENKNPTDESIVNNTTPQTQDNHKIKKKKKKQNNTNGSGNSSTDTAPQTQGNQNQEKIRVKIMFHKTDPTNSRQFIKSKTTPQDSR